MNSPFKIYTYASLEDRCVSYSIIKEIAKNNEIVECYTDGCSENLSDLFTRLYSNLKNVHVIREPYNHEKHKANHAIANTAVWFKKVKPWIENPLLPLPEWISPEWLYDRQYYMNANMSFNLKWDNFHFDRDINKEKEVFYDIFGLKDNEEFIFINDNGIDEKYVDKSLRKINLHDYSDVAILDTLYTIEHSKEFHSFKSGLTSFVDQMQIKHDNLFYHEYVRPMPFEQPGLRLSWKKIKNTKFRATLPITDELYLCTYVGMGDILICYGLIKELSKRYKKIYYYVEEHYYDNTVRLCKNLPNVELIIVEKINKILQVHPDSLVVGWRNYEETTKIIPDLHGDQFFYDFVNMPLEKKWENFDFERDIEKEKDIFYNKLGLTDNEDFIFIHEDADRNMILNRKYITPGKRIINLTDYKDISILDCLYIVEKSSEVHVMNSAVVQFIDLMQIKHNNLFYHRYLNQNPYRSSEHSQFSVKLKWKIV